MNTRAELRRTYTKTLRRVNQDGLINTKILIAMKFLCFSHLNSNSSHWSRTSDVRKLRWKFFCYGCKEKRPQQANKIQRSQLLEMTSKLFVFYFSFILSYLLFKSLVGPNWTSTFLAYIANLQTSKSNIHTFLILEMIFCLVYRVLPYNYKL